MADGDEQGGFRVMERRPVDVSREAPIVTPAQNDTSGFTVLDQRPISANPLVSIEHGRQRAAQADADIDYNTGAPYSVRALFQSAANPDEQFKTLQKYYPGEFGKAFGQDRNGNWWVRQFVEPDQNPARSGFTPFDPFSARPNTANKGSYRRVAVMPQGLSGGLRNFLSGAAAAPGETAGAAGGAIVGEVMFPAGGGIPGAIVGATLGNGLDQLTKWVQGRFSQTPKEVVRGMATGGTIAGLLQGGGPLARKFAFDPARRYFQKRWATTMDPVTGKQTPAAAFGLELASPTRGPTLRTAGPPGPGGTPPRSIPGEMQPGAVPPIGSYAPGMQSLKAKQELRDMLSGPGGTEAERRNVLYLNTRMRGILATEGFSPEQTEQFMTEVMEKSYRQSTARAGEAISAEAKAQFQAMENDWRVARDEAERMLIARTRSLVRVSQAPESLPEAVADTVVTERRRFGRNFADVYRQIDHMTGDRDVVPTDLIIAQARSFSDAMSPPLIPRIIQQWAQDNRSHIGFEQAHALRTYFREHGDITDVAAAGMAPHHMRQMAKAVDDAIAQAEGTMGQQAAAALRSTDALYREGIRRFDNTLINRMVQDVRSGIAPGPERFVETFMKPDQVQLVRQMWRWLPADRQRQVLQADLMGMLNRAGEHNDRGMLVVNGKRLMRELDTRAPLMDAVYPRQEVQDLRLYATQLAALEGDVDATAMTDLSHTTSLLREAVGAKRAADYFAKQNPIYAFVNGTPDQIDSALAQITRPGREAVTAAAAESLGGVDSAPWREVRRDALHRLFTKAIIERRELQKTVAGDPINAELSRYTQRQQDLLFPNGLADDLRTLAQEARFLFPGAAGGDIGSSLAKATILQKMPLSLPRLLGKQISGWIADHPRVLHFLAEEVKESRLKFDPTRVAGPKVHLTRARSIMQTISRFVEFQGFRSLNTPSGPPDPNVVSPTSLVGKRPGDYTTPDKRSELMRELGVEDQNSGGRDDMLELGMAVTPAGGTGRLPAGHSPFSGRASSQQIAVIADRYARSSLWSNPKNVEYALKLYVDNKKSTAEIANIFDVSPTSVQSMLRETGVEMRRQSAGGASQRVITDEILAKAKTLRGQGMGWAAIAERFGLNPESLRTLFFRRKP